MTWSPERRRSSLRCAAAMLLVDSPVDDGGRDEYAAKVLNLCAEVIETDSRREQAHKITRLLAHLNLGAPVRESARRAGIEGDLRIL